MDRDLSIDVGSNVFILVGEVDRLGDGAPLLPGCIVVLRCPANSLLYPAPENGACCGTGMI